MAYVNWPATVGTTILQDGYTCTRTPSLIATDTDTGPQQVRLRSRYAPRQHTIQLKLNRTKKLATGRTEYMEFVNFVENTLSFGMLHTLFPLPDDYTDTNPIIKECRFVVKKDASPYSTVKWYGEDAYVQFTLEEVAG